MVAWVAVTKRSKSSLTTDEIEAYWRYKQQEMETLSKERNALQNANTLPVGFSSSSILSVIKGIKLRYMFALRVRQESYHRMNL